MAKKSSGERLSLRKKDATEGGGTEGALATITEIEFIDEFTYGGRFKDSPAAALRVVFEIDGFERPWEQHYSVGPSKNYEVVDDGDGIRGLGKQTGLNKKSPAYAFIASVEDAIEEAEADIDALMPNNGVGGLKDLRVRLTNKKLQTVGGDEKEYILVGSLAEDDEPSNSSKSNGKSKSSPKSDDIEEKTIDAVKELIEEHTSVKKGDLPDLVYRAHKKDPDAKAMMQLCFKDSFVADGPWSFDKKKGILRAE